MQQDLEKTQKRINEITQELDQKFSGSDEAL